LTDLSKAVRPYLTILISTAITVIAVRLVWMFGNVDMAQMMLGFLLGSGATIMGFYYRERSRIQ